MTGERFGKTLSLGLLRPGDWCRFRSAGGVWGNDHVVCRTQPIFGAKEHGRDVEQLGGNGLIPCVDVKFGYIHLKRHDDVVICSLDRDGAL